MQAERGFPVIVLLLLSSAYWHSLFAFFPAISKLTKNKISYAKNSNKEEQFFFQIRFFTVSFTQRFSQEQRFFTVSFTQRRHLQVFSGRQLKGRQQPDFAQPWRLVRGSKARLDAP